MNIITSGIEQKQKIKFKQEVGDKGYLRSSLGYTSGQLKGGWGVTFAGSYKQGNGWVDRAFTKGWFYYLKVDKRLGKHIVSFTAMGAPQEHGQRRYRKPIATYDVDYASSLGITKQPEEYFNDIYLNPNYMVNKGLRYNSDWGKYTNLDGKEITLNDKKNYYHKPLFTLRHLWSASEKFYLSNIVYLSLGDGGGTSFKKSIKSNEITDEGQINIQKFYDMNVEFSKSYNYLRSNKNNHNWIGLLSTFNYQLSDEFTLSGGIDLRRYVGAHYEEVYDLLGGSYTADLRDPNRDPLAELHEGDKINYHNDAIVEWGGLFGQLEYKTGLFSAFVNLTAAYTGYKKIDYFQEKQITVGDTVLSIGYGEEKEYNGQVYNQSSPGLDWAQSDWKWISGYTAKGGVNYNLTEKSNIFTNLGYMSKAPMFRNIYERNTLDLLRNIENEFIKAIELGYSYRNHLFSFNTNAYYTIWENKPGRQERVDLGDEQFGYMNIQGMDALHKGVELDFAVKILDNLKFNGLLSIGDWKYTSADSVRVYDDNNVHKKTVFFNAKGVHVGDAAQTQYGASLRYEPIKKLYFTGRTTFFDRYYSDFNPLNLDPVNFPESFDENGDPVDAWKTPSYILVDFHAGYSMKYKKVRFDLRASILNAFDELYISDARDNDSFSSYTTSHDAMSAGVFLGLGRRFNVSLKITL